MTFTPSTAAIQPAHHQTPAPPAPPQITPATASKPTGIAPRCQITQAPAGATNHEQSRGGSIPCMIAAGGHATPGGLPGAKYARADTPGSTRKPEKSSGNGN